MSIAIFRKTIESQIVNNGEFWRAGYWFAAAFLSFSTTRF